MRADIPIDISASQESARKRLIRGRFILTETIGSLGDMGTFVPIVIALVMLVGMDAATILVFAGLANIVTGLVFRIPIPVQPMKAIAALAIVGHMTASQVCAAGVLVGILLLALALLGMIRHLDRIIPNPVVRAIQLSVAVKLGLKALSLGFLDPATQSLRPMWGPNGLVVLAVAGAILLLLVGRWRWAALGLVFLGLIVAAHASPALLSTTNVTFWQPSMVSLDAGELFGALRGAIAQIPLTLLNSVFAVSLLAAKLLPATGKHATPVKTALSVGFMNLLSCPFGGIPVCHGSGGLAAQYAFGARTGLSMVILGAAKLLAGLLFGAAALAWMQAFPVTVLAAFLLLAALALGQASRFWQNHVHFVVAGATLGVYFATGLLPAGFAAGWAAHAIWTSTVENSQADRQRLVGS